MVATSGVDAAREYLARGFAPIPLRRKGKEPVGKNWPELRITEKDVDRHFALKRNIGLLLGEASGGLIDLDIDSDEAVLLADEFLPKTGMISGRGARARSHFWFRSIGAATRQFHGVEGMVVELRADGAQTMAPPSIHPSGDTVAWDESGEPSLVEYDELLSATARLAAAVVLGRAWPSAGTRHEAALAVAGLLLTKGVKADVAKKLIWAAASIGDDDEVDARVQCVDSTQEALANDRHVTAKARAVELLGKEPIDLVAKHLGLTGMPSDGSDGKSAKKSQADKLVELAASFELFWAIGEADSGYAHIETEGKKETLRIDSLQFTKHLLRAFWVVHQKAPSKRALQDALGVIAGKAVYEGEGKPVFVRVGEHEGAIYLDLGDDQHRVVRVAANGWSIESESPVRFLRPHGLLELPCPKKGGDLELLRPFVNVEDGDDWILVRVWLISAIRPGFPCPILALHGEQGSAKSFTSKILRSIVDPNIGDLRPQPKDARDLAIATKNSLVLCFDNISFINGEMSDALCRIVTGGAFGTRKLYSDSDEVLFEAKRPIILNGIPDLAAHSDLVDRMIPLLLPSIPPGKRRTEKELWTQFEKVRGEILGGVLDAVCMAMKNSSTVVITELPRMADFAVWGSAAEDALGCSPGEFMKAYTRSRNSAIGMTLEGLSLTSALRAFLQFGDGVFEGTATRLYQEMGRNAAVQRIIKGRRDWPKAPNILSGQLRRYAPAMRQIGFEVVFSRTSSVVRERRIRIARIKKKSTRKARRRSQTSGQESSGHARRKLK